MNKFTLSLLLLLSIRPAFAQLNEISGKITDTQNGYPIPGATILIKELSVSTITNHEGNFTIRVANPGKVLLAITHIGYEPVNMTFNLENKPIVANISLKPGYQISNVVVVSASKRPEKIVDAPASIQVIGAKELEQFSGTNVNELIALVQGVEFTRSGVADITFNARGLHNAFNNKILQLVDGRNSMSSLSGNLPIMNRGTTIKDDIEKLEIVLGPQSALHGTNANNAVFNYLTKDPRTYQGTTLSVSAGSRYQFSSRIRQATKINEKWAFKLTGEYATGREFEFYDSVYAGNQTGTTPFFGPPVSIPERNVDFNFRHIRGEGNLFYNINPRMTVILSGGNSKHSIVQVTTAGRNQMRDLAYAFAQARLVHPRFFANLYNTWGSLGTSYSISNYTRDFWNRTHSTLTSGPNRHLSPDSAELAALRNRFKEESQRLNAEVQYNYTFEKAGLLLVAGLNYQKETPNGFGVTLVDDSVRIKISQYGAVLHLDKKLPFNIRAVVAMRFDRHDNFGSFYSPKFALVKGVGRGNFRITWGKGYAMPSIQNQYAGIGRILFGNGGTGIYYIPNLANVRDTSAFLTTTALKPEQVSTLEIGYKGTVLKNLFIDINYYNGISKNYISPSRTVAGRIISINGIKVVPAIPGTIVNDTLRNASFSTFFNYGEVRAYGLDVGISYTFSKFLSLAARYSWFGSDISKNNLKNDANKDGYVSLEERSLNAPTHRGNLILNLDNLHKEKLSLSISARFVESYDFYSASQIGTASGKGKRGVVERPGQPPIRKNFDWGPLGGFTTIDLRGSYKLNEMVRFNLGITNLLDTDQVEFVASPSIGRLYMAEVKLSIPQLSKKL